MAYISGNPNVSLGQVSENRGGQFTQGYQPVAPPAPPPNPLAEALGKFGTGLSSGFEKGLQKQIQRQSLAKLLEMHKSNPEMGPIERIQAIAELPPELQKYAADIFEQEKKQQLASQQGQNFSSALSNIMGGGQSPTGTNNQVAQRQSQQQTGLPNQQATQAIASVTDPNQQKILYDAVKQKQDQAFKVNERMVETEQKRSAPQLTAYDEYAKTLPYRESSLRQQEEAVKKGLTIGDFLADLSGKAELLRSPQGAQFKVAGKDYFLNSLQRVQGRPNQWIEQQLSDAQAKIGRSKEANLQTIAAQKFDIDVGKKELELANELSKMYRDQLGYVPGDLVQEVHKALKPFVLDKQKELGYEMQRIHEQENPKEFNYMIRVTPGTPLTAEKAKWILDKVGGDIKKAEKAAKDAGYDITFMPKSEG